MRYVRDALTATLGSSLMCLFFLACSGKSEKSPVVDDAKRAPAVPVDAAIVVDARAPFAMTEKTSSFGNSVEVHPHDAKCPSIEWRKPNTVTIARCRDKPFAEQTEALRDMVSYMRGVDHAFENVRLFGSADYYSYPELAKRLATYAQRVPYDAKKGLNRYTIEAAAAEEMAPELAVIFQRKPKLISLEKCSAGRPNGKNETGEWLRKEGFTGTALLPLGCAMAHWEFDR